LSGARSDAREGDSFLRQDRLASFANFKRFSRRLALPYGTWRPSVSGGGFLVLPDFLDESGDVLGVGLPAIDQFRGVHTEHCLVLIVNRPTEGAAGSPLESGCGQGGFIAMQHGASKVRRCCIDHGIHDAKLQGELRFPQLESALQHFGWHRADWLTGLRPATGRPHRWPGIVSGTSATEFRSFAEDWRRGWNIGQFGKHDGLLDNWFRVGYLFLSGLWGSAAIPRSPATTAAMSSSP
jgi:hypothetical protein